MIKIPDVVTATLSDKKFWLYSIIGLSGAMLDLILYIIFYKYLGIPPVIASFLSVSFGITNNFVWNSRHNFRVKDALLKRFLNFYGIGIGGAVLSSVMIFILFNGIGIDPTKAKLLTIPPVVLLQFLLNKRFSFNERKKSVANKNIIARLPSWRRIMLWILVSLPVVCVFIYTSITFYTNSISFDEGYNLQVPANLVNGNGYASNGSQFKGHAKLFDPFVSTGPTLLVPLALIFKFIGIGALQYRVLTYLIYIAFCVLTVWFVMKAPKISGLTRLEKYIFGLFALSLSIGFLSTSVVSDQFFFTMAQGEPLAICFILLSFILLQYKKIYWAAIMLGLAVLTKLLFFLLVPFFILEIIRFNNPALREKIKRIAVSLGVILSPSILFEIYRFHGLYNNLQNYVDSWREFIHFFKIAGGDPNTANAPLTILLNRLQNLSGIDNTPFHILSIILFFVISLAAYGAITIIRKSLKITVVKSFKKPTFNAPFIYGLGSVALWMFWWLMVSSTGWTRYAIVPVNLLIVFCVILLFTINSNFRGIMGGLLIILTAITCSFIVRENNLTNKLSKQRAVTKAVSTDYEISDQAIYHFGWWQNPEFQFLTGRSSKMYIPEKTNNTDWVLMSDLQKKLLKAEYEEHKAMCKDIIEYGYYRICKL